MPPFLRTQETIEQQYGFRRSGVRLLADGRASGKSASAAAKRRKGFLDGLNAGIRGKRRPDRPEPAHPHGVRSAGPVALRRAGCAVAPCAAESAELLMHHYCFCSGLGANGSVGMLRAASAFRAIRRIDPQAAAPMRGLDARQASITEKIAAVLDKRLSIQL